MPFQINSLSKAVQKFCDESVNKPTPHSIYEVTTTTVAKKLNCEFIYSKADKGFIYYDNKNKALPVFFVSSALEVSDSIARSSYYGDHKNVKTDEDWLKLYDYSARAMTGKFANAWDTLYLDVMPCYYCGLALPLYLIEVDHWFERNNHASGAVQALLKVFRASGHALTLAGPSGVKGSQFAGILKGKVATVGTRGTVTQLKTKVKWSYRLNPLREDLVDQKRQLTVNGLIMLSILYHATDAITSVDSFCQMFVNHFINLAPTCPNCNKLKNTR
jgi:hypothetical protein